MRRREIKEIVTMHSEEGDNINTSVFSDYRDVNGIKFPYAVNIDISDQAITLKVTDIKINSGFGEADFK